MARKFLPTFYIKEKVEEVDITLTNFKSSTISHILNNTSDSIRANFSDDQNSYPKLTLNNFTKNNYLALLFMNAKKISFQFFKDDAQVGGLFEVEGLEIDTYLFSFEDTALTDLEKEDVNKVIISFIEKREDSKSEDFYLTQIYKLTLDFQLSHQVSKNSLGKLSIKRHLHETIRGRVVKDVSGIANGFILNYTYYEDSLDGENLRNLSILSTARVFAIFNGDHTVKNAEFNNNTIALYFMVNDFNPIPRSTNLNSGTNLNIILKES